jgi:glycerol-3-phosphate O-acyltransferase
MRTYLDILRKDIADRKLTPEIGDTLTSFYNSYIHALERDGIPTVEPIKTLLEFHQIIMEEIRNPYTFGHYHQAEHTPHDYYKIGMDLFRPLIKMEESKFLGQEQVVRIEEQLKQKHNVIFLANHQAEPDPQAIGLLLEKNHPKLAEAITYVAGHRVVSDPLAKPFSRGRNLFCIFSKRHIENPPEHKEAKQHHNQQTMRRMGEKLAEGGLCIYVAPSGGRDRPGPDGEPILAPFDPQSIEMFALIAKKSGTPTHFYPMSLVTFDLLPPPDTILTELGEARNANRTPVHMAIGHEIDMQNFPGSEETDKKAWRQKRADYIWQLVADGYSMLSNNS